jgi:hypothetical protein
VKKLLFVLALALSALIPGAQAQGPIVGPGNIILCGKIANMAVGPTSVTQVIAAVAGTSIHLCGWHVTNTGATGTFSITSGSGGTCVTSNAVIVTVQNVTSTAPSADHQQYAYFSVAPVSGTAQAICVTPSVATIAATIFYAQF